MFFSFLVWLLDHAWILVSHVTGRSSFPKPLAPDKEKLYIERMQTGDDEARQKLILHNLRLVAHIAKKYSHTMLEQEDMVSIGTIGLIKAVGTYKPDSGTQLVTYAARCIENEILMALRMTKKQRQDVSLQDPIGTDREGNEIMLLDILGTDCAAVENEAEIFVESEKAIRIVRELLPKREQIVIMMRYGLADGVPRAQHEIAKALGISRSYVSRIEKKALERIHLALCGDKTTGGR